jgi:hypothetical protein
MGYILLGTAAAFLGITALQVRAGVIFRPIFPLYRDSEPIEFWVAIGGSVAVWLGVMTFAFYLVLHPTF